jgi:CubicO group peptidase (beta-lactamase class C family)
MAVSKDGLRVDVANTTRHSVSAIDARRREGMAEIRRRLPRPASKINPAPPGSSAAPGRPRDRRREGGAPQARGTLGDRMTASSPPIDGVCDPAFAALREVFQENLETRGEVGAAVCAVVGDRVVADLWGGHRDEARSAPWQRDTLVNAYSVGKGVAAMLTLQLVSEGALELDAPVASLWPEFAVEGKAGTTLRMFLAHQAGLPAVRAPLPDEAWRHWEAMTAALAGQRPFWEPGKAHGYHVNTFGFLVGELVRRATGRHFGAALRERLCAPLSADYHVGLPESEHARVAPVLGHTARRISEAGIDAFVQPGADPERDLMLRHTYFNPPGLAGMGSVNTRAWRLAEVPSTNGHGTARGVAALYAGVLAGRAGIEAPVLEEALRVQSDGPDRVLERPSRFGLGFQLHCERRPIGHGARGFGHYGHGGSLGFADPDAELAFGYVTNLPGPRWQAPRTQALVDAVYASLGRP